MSLVDYQRAMLEALFNRTQTGAMSALAEHVGAEQGRGVDVHRRNVVYGVVNGMLQTYATCTLVLGEGNLKYLAREFMMSRPPRRRDVADVGDGFADFLSGRAEVAAVPFLPDLAALEWAVAQVARDHRPRTLAVEFAVEKLWALTQQDRFDEVNRVASYDPPRTLHVAAQDGLVAVTPRG